MRRGPGGGGGRWSVGRFICSGELLPPFRDARKKREILPPFRDACKKQESGGKGQPSAGVVPLLVGVNFCFLQKSVQACLTWEVQLSLSHVTSLLVI